MAYSKPQAGEITVPRWKSTLRVSIMIVSSALSMGYLFWDLDWPLFLKTLSRFNLVWASISIALALTTYLLMSLRLNFLLGAKIKLPISIRSTILSLGLNSILPSRLGDVAKSVYLKRTASVSYPLSIASQIWERFFDVNIIVLVSLVALVPQTGQNALILLSCCSLTAWILLFVAKLRPQAASILLEKFTPKILREGVSALFIQIIAPVSLASILRMTVLSAAIWLTFMLFLYTVFAMSAQLVIPLRIIATAFVAISLGAMIPALPGSLGVLEAAIVLSLSLAGVDKSQALPAALLMRILFCGPSMLFLAPIMLSSNNIFFSAIITRSRTLRGQ